MSIILNPSTTLLLIKTVPYIVYLDKFNAPDYNLTIRDTTGNATNQSSIILSTINSAIFSDGTYTEIIDRPNGLIQLGFRNSTVWQVQHTSGLPPADSAANINIINTSTLYTKFHSTIYKNISSLIVENLNTDTINLQTNIINFNGLSTSGITIIKSFLNVSSLTTVQENVNISSSVIFQSSLQAYSLNTSSMYVYSNIFTNNIQTNNFISISSIQLQNLIQICTLQIQKSTPGIILNTSTLNIGNTLSTFSSLNVFGSTIVNNSILANGFISSLSSLYIGNSLVTNNNIFTNSISSIGNIYILSSLSSAITNIRGILYNNSSISIGSSVSSLYYSTISISSFGSISSGISTIVASNFTIDSISTNSLITQALNIGYNLNAQGSISTNNLTTSTIQIRGNINISSITTINIITGLSTNVGSSLNVFTTNIIQNTLVNGFLSTIDQLSTNKSFGIGGSVYIGGNLYGGLNLSSSTNFINNITLNNLTVTTSSVAINASSISLSNVTNNLYIFSTPNVLFNRNNVFASTLISPNVNIQSGKIDNIYTNNVYIGSVSLQEQQRFGFFISSPSYFPQGFSTQNISANTIYGGFFAGKHIGDAYGLTNTVLNFNDFSAPTAFLSNISTNVLYTSTLLISSLIITQNLSITSSITLPNLVIQGIGYPLQQSTNKIIITSLSTLLINNSLFFDMTNKFIGINTLTPTVSLDISGSINYSTIFYSSIQNVNVSSLSYNFTNITVSTLILNTLSTTNITFSNFTNNLIPPLSIRSFNTNTISSYITSFPYLISAYLSSLVFNNIVKIVNSTNKISITSDQSLIQDPLYSLDVIGITTISSLLTSTINIQTLVTPIINLSCFTLYGNSTSILSLTISTNQLLTNPSTISFNNLLYINYSNYNVGIGFNSTPKHTLDVMGNAYFSSLEGTEIKFGGISFGIQTL